MKTFMPKMNKVLVETINIQQGKNQTLKLIPLGGVGDVTKNMYIYEYGNDIVIVDCGVGFPDDAMPGVDLVIPDISYLRDKINKIRGIIITHGHDDHIGGLPYIWPELQVPIYTRKLTAGFIRTKFTEHNLSKSQIKEVRLSDKLQLGAFLVSFYQVSHSVPDSMGVVLKTPLGRIVHQADFKIDWTPVSQQVTDVGAAALLGVEGVKLLLIDCLRIDKAGFNRSEKSIEDSFEKAALETPGKLLITMTSSNVSRMQQAINIAQKLNKKIVVTGRSFENNFQVARDLGYLNVPPGIIMPVESLSSFSSSKILILIAGAQGQPSSSLSRVANNEHKYVKLKSGDAVVFSADPIPSTETAQNALIDSLTRLGVNVYYSAITSDLHVSGHAASEELKLMVSLIKPTYLLPIGGTYRHMRIFSKVFSEMGYPKDKILEPENGDILEIGKDNIKLSGRIDIQNIFVDGLGIGDVSHVVLRDRKVMSEEGIVIVLVPLNQRSGMVEGEVDIISRGFVFEAIAEDLLDEAKQVVRTSLTTHGSKTTDWRFMRKVITEELEKFLYRATERRPLILPLVVEI